MSSLVLASGSSTRRKMLENAGLSYTAVSPLADEDGLKESLLAERCSPRDLVDYLAEAKAMSLVSQYPKELIVGSDQILLHGNTVLSKPVSRDEAVAHLQTLSGDTHQLMTSAVIVSAGLPVWRVITSAKLRMRSLDSYQIDAYLDAIGDAAFQSVGSYQLEGLGVNLFENIEGDFFTILGMPLVPLLQQLRLLGFDGMMP